MTNSILKIFALSCIVTISLSCNSYKDYAEVYNKDGIIVLKTKTRNKTDSFSSSKNLTLMPFRVDPDDGREISDPKEAKTMIDNFQRTCGNLDTRYIDFYFLNLSDFIKRITATNPNELDKFGIRLYFAKVNDHGIMKNNIVVGPIKNTGKHDPNNMDIVEPVWVSDPTNYKSFDYGAMCPDRCTNATDLTGYKLP